ncbi:SAM-dependent methyltransferase [Cellulomonas alba]|uniref:Class I SAM-dependent methyltransferase n=1 Tax=Cellulomonas alba TaxID=3053467 RepID=A0ABT7SFZ5_9CELL|nr:class I SAM-dependent methyltransferase [Cellulomonas alba]MDM7854959.1 class I SAM-dependent methyltransferase [Cellulomonas alba]
MAGHQDPAHGHAGGGHTHGGAHGGSADDLARLHTREFWEERYGSADRVWSGHPNRAVVDEVVGLTPGRALDVAAGEGGDAIWLAELGWRVTALDHAQAAVDRGAAHAADRGVGDRITWVRADARTWRTDERFDLVTSAYLHLPAGTREPWLASVAELVAPGGWLLVVGHHVSDIAVVPRPDAPELFAEAAELAALLDPAAFEIVTAATKPRDAVDPDGNPVTVHDAVLRARRREVPTVG